MLKNTDSLLSVFFYLYFMELNRRYLWMLVKCYLNKGGN